jgi:hypothetical protein
MTAAEVQAVFGRPCDRENDQFIDTDGGPSHWRRWGCSVLGRDRVITVWFDDDDRATEKMMLVGTTNNPREILDDSDLRQEAARK